MKFLSFINSQNKASWGVLNADTGRVLELFDLAPSLLDFIQNSGSQKISQIQSRLSHADIDAKQIRIQACIPRPTSMRDGYAFRQHVEAARRNRGVPMIAEFDDFPVFYFTNHQSVFGPGPIEVLSRHLDQLDFELESAIVIGKKCRNVSASEADKVVFG